MPITYEEYMQQLGESPKQQKKPKKITYEEYMKQLDSQVVDTQVPEIKAAPQKAIKSSPLTTFALGVSKPLQEFNLNLAKAIESYGNLGINLANRLNPVSKYVAQNILKLDTSPETPELKPVTLTPATEYYQNQLQTVEQRLQQAPADTAHKIAAGAGQFVGNAISDIPMILTGGATAEAAIAKYLPNFAKMAPEAQQFVKAIMAAPGYTTSKKAIMEHRLPTAQEYAEDAAMFGAFDLGGQVLGKMFSKLKQAGQAVKTNVKNIQAEAAPIEETIKSTTTETAPVTQPEIKKNGDTEALLESLIKRRETKEVTSKTATSEVQQPASKIVKPGFKQTEVEIIKKAGFDDSAEAHLALEAAKNGKEWFAKEFPGLPETAYQEIVNKAKAIPKGIQFNIQYFAKNNPEAVQAAKDKLISRFRANTIERAVMIPPEVKENLKPEEFDYIPQTSKEWQEKAMKNVTENQEKVMEEIRNAEALSGGVQAHEAAIITQKLTEEAKRTGDYSKLLDWTKMVAQKTRETARALKGTDTAWEKTKSPEGALTKAQRVIENANRLIEETDPRKSEKIKQGTQKVKAAINVARKQAAAKTAEEMLAGRISTSFGKGGVPQRNPIHDMVNELFKVAKESPLNHGKSPAPSPVEFLKQAIQERGKYREVWEKAKEIVKNKYKDDPAALKLLNDYFKNQANPEYSQATLQRSINISMKDLSMKLDELARQFKGDRNDSIAKVKDFLIRETGANGQSADVLAEQVYNRLTQNIEEKSRKILQNIFREKEPRPSRDIVKSIDELSALGAFNDANYKNKITEKLTPKVRALLKENNINLGQLVKQSLSNVEFSRVTFLKNLTERMNIQNDDALKILNECEKIFNDLVQAKKQSILKNMFKPKEPAVQKTLTEKVIELVNLGAYNDQAITDLIRAKEGMPVLDSNDVKFIIDTMENSKRFPDGSREQAVEIAKVKQRIVSKLPVTLGEKISTYQTIAQLLNPKTWLRNIGGNLVFGLSEKLSDVAGAALDKAISIYSGKRTKLMPDIATEAKGFFRGAKETWQDFRFGIDTYPSATQFDLPRKQVFKKGPFSQAEKVTSLGLKMGDNPFYQSAYDSALKEQMKIAGSKVATEDMIKQAHEVARYRTFQDFNAISNLFSTLKHTLNFKKGKLAGTGFGDLVLKYPKTPANLLARAIDYSPAGYLNSLNQLYKGLQGEFNQRKFVDSLSRATVGTGMFLAGITLYNLGIVTGKSDQDKDVNILQQATGLGQYKINLSALKRFLTTFDPKAAKLQPGDKFMSYDWILPMAIPVTMGVNLSAAYQRHKRVRALDVIGSVVTAIEGGASALAEQPVVKGLADLFRGYNSQDIVNNLIETAASAPSSFIPTLMNQIRQITDNVKRNVQGENAVETGINLVKNKIPGLSKTLPARIDTLGQTQTVYQDNSLFNVLLNPAYTSEFKSNPAVKLILDLYDKTGEKTHFPRVAPKAFSFNGQKYELTQQEQVKLQEYMGKMTTEEFTKLAKNPRFMRLKDELKVKVLKSYLDVISDRAKIQLLKDKGVIKAR